MTSVPPDHDMGQEEKAREEEVHAGMSESEMRSNLIRLVFGGDPRRFEAFCAELELGVPPDTAAVVRGSAVTGVRWEDGTPFDSRGPGTSDVDLTLVGGEILGLYEPDGFYIAGVHTRPLSDKRPDIAPSLVPLRQRLIAMVHRPVDIQGTRDWVMFVREYLMGQPYLTIIGKLEES